RSAAHLQWDLQLRPDALRFRGQVRLRPDHTRVQIATLGWKPRSGSAGELLRALNGGHEVDAVPLADPRGFGSVLGKGAYHFIQFAEELGTVGGRGENEHPSRCRRRALEAMH